MRKFVAFSAIVAAVGGAFLYVRASSKSDLQTVARVDLSRYVGRWYEIARYPNRFERDCVSDVSAEYSLLANGKLAVVNSCRKGSGEFKRANGVAKIADTQTNARLRVTFFWPFYGDYWVIGLDPDYRWAIVGEPSRKYLWVLSRTPNMDAATSREIEQNIRDAGYDPSRLIRPKHSPAA